MADAIDELITAVIQREGGYVNDPRDAGGPTKFGITLATLQAWRRKPVGALDVEHMDEDEARQIYRCNYFQMTGFEHVADSKLQGFLFDWGVNSGPSTASKGLQAALGVTADGVVGPQTLAALSKDTNPKALFYMVKAERLEFLLRCIGSHAENAAFAIGWANRNDQFEEK